MIDINSLARVGRYLSGVLVAIFTVNLLLDSQVVPFVNTEPFLGSVAQFLVLLVASAMISIEFMVADQRATATESQDVESESHAESPVETTPES